MQGPRGALVSKRLAAAEIVPHQPLGGAPHLPVSRGDVVDDGVAENMLVRLGQRDVTPGFADDDGEFGFAIELLRERAVMDDVVLGSDHAVRGLDEELGLLAAGGRSCFLRIVVAVVAAAAQDRARPQRRFQPDVVHRKPSLRWRLGHGTPRKLEARLPGADEGQRVREGLGIAVRQAAGIENAVAVQESEAFAIPVSAIRPTARAKHDDFHIGSVRQGSSSFLKKRTRKTFTTSSRAYSERPQPNGQEFFCFFSAKKKAFP